MKKKIIKISLATILFSNSILQADGSWQWGNKADYGSFGLGSNVGGKVYQSSDSVGYQGFGNYKFKIKSYQPTPWYHITPPSATLGCGGFSFKGGFLSLINLDQLGDQLKDAGAALAWGIVLGLVTSLPSIKEVFDTINSWARKIQNLLANACSAGQKLGGMARGAAIAKWKGQDAKTKADSVSKSDPDHMSEMQDSQSDPFATITNALDDANAWATSPSGPDEKQNIIATLTSGYVPFIQSMYMTQVISTVLNKNYKLKDVFNESNYSGDISDKSKLYVPFGYPKRINDQKEMTFRMLIGFLVGAETGSSGISGVDEDIIQKYFVELSKLTNGKGDKDTAKERLSDLEDKFSKSSILTIKYSLNSGTSTVADAILKWAESGDVSDIQKFKIPYFIGVKKNVVSGKAKSYYIMEVANPNSSEAGGTVGAFLGSDSASWGSFSSIAQKQLDCLKLDANITGCDTLPPVLSPNVRDWMYIYSQSTKDDKLLLEDDLRAKLTMDLRDVFIRYTEDQCRLIANSFSASVSSSDSTSSSKSFSKVGSQSDKKMEPFSVKCNKFVKKLKEGFQIKALKDTTDRLAKEATRVNIRNIQRTKRVSKF